MSFLYEIKQVVKINESGEIGTVIARCEYMEATNNYLIRYRTKMGVATEAWWSESALVAM